MERLRVFISAVTSEFGSYREELARALRKRGCYAVLMEEMPAHSGTAIEKVASHIDQCTVMIALAGDRYGAQSPEKLELPSGDLSLSYTNWEYIYGMKKEDMHVFTFLPTPDAPRDFSAPGSSAKLEDGKYVDRQKAFVNAVIRERDKWDRERFTDARDLVNKVLNISELAGNRYGGQAFTDPYQNKVNPDCPYIGLKSFTEKTKDYFFGRDEIAKELLDRIEHSPLTVAIGNSGAGKSSLLRAWILPKWREKNSIHRLTFFFRPNQNPYEEISRVLAENLDHQSSDDIEKVVKEVHPSSVFQRLSEKFREQGDEWLFVIDQFEHLFTRVSDEKVRKMFISDIVEAVEEYSDLGLRFVIAMRDDFYGELRDFEEFLPLADFHYFRITPMRRDEVTLVIEEPAALHGVAFERGVVEEICDDVHKRSAALPLLQYTLQALWADSHVKENRLIGMKAYKEMGGVEGALKQAAIAFYEGLSEEERTKTRNMLLRLIDVGDAISSSKLTSRSAREDELLAVGDKAILSKLLDSVRLLISGDEENPVIELAHEAVIAGWPDLRGWAEQNRHELQLERSLESDLARWKELDEEQEKVAATRILWDGDRISRIEEVSASGLVLLDQKKKEFLDRSRRKNSLWEYFVLRDSLQDAAMQWNESGRDAELLWQGHILNQVQSALKHGKFSELMEFRDDVRLKAIESCFVDSSIEEDERKRPKRIRIVTITAIVLVAFIAFFGRVSWKRDKAAKVAMVSYFMAEASAEVRAGNWANALGYLAQYPKKVLGSAESDTFLLNLLLQNNWAYKREYLSLVDVNGEPTSDESWIEDGVEKPNRNGKRMVLPGRGWFSIDELGKSLIWQPQPDANLETSDIPVLFDIGLVSKDSLFVDGESAQEIQFPIPYLDSEGSDPFYVFAISNKWLRAVPFAETNANSSFSGWKLIGPLESMYAPVSLMNDQDRIPHSAWFTENRNQLMLVDSYKNGTSINAREHRSVEASLFSIAPTAALINGRLLQSASTVPDAWNVSNNGIMTRERGEDVRGEEDTIESSCGRFEARFSEEGIELTNLGEGWQTQLLIRRNERMQCKFSPSGNFLLVLGQADGDIDNSELYVFDPKTSQLLWNPIPGVYGASLSSDERWILTLHGPDYLTDSTAFEFLGEFNYEEESKLMLRDISSGGDLVLVPIFYPANLFVECPNDDRFFELACPEFGEGSLRTLIPSLGEKSGNATSTYLEWEFPICEERGERLPSWFGEFAEAVACRKLNLESGLLESYQPNEALWERLRGEALAMKEPWGETAVRLTDWYSEAQDPPAILKAKNDLPPDVLLYEVFSPWFWYWLGDDDIETQYRWDPESFLWDKFNQSLAMKRSRSAFLGGEKFVWPKEVLRLWEVSEEEANSPSYWLNRRRNDLMQLRAAKPIAEATDIEGMVHQELAKSGWVDPEISLISDEVLTAFLLRRDVSAEYMAGFAYVLHEAPSVFGDKPENPNRENLDRYELISKWIPKLLIEAMERDASLETAPYLNEIAVALVKSRRYAEANSFFLRSERLDPKSVTTYLAAYSAAVSGEKENAQRFLSMQDMSEEGWIDPLVGVYHGWAQFQLGEFEKGSWLFYRLLKNIAVVSDSGEVEHSDFHGVLMSIASFIQKSGEDTGEIIGEAIVGYAICQWSLDRKENAISAYSFLLEHDESMPYDEKSMIPGFWKGKDSFVSLRWAEKELAVLRSVFEATKNKLGAQRFSTITEDSYFRESPSVLRAEWPHYFVPE